MSRLKIVWVSLPLFASVLVQGLLVFVWYLIVVVVVVDDNTFTFELDVGARFVLFSLPGTFVMLTNT